MAESTDSPPLFVIDASFLLAYLLPDEKMKNVDEYFEKFLCGKIEFISTPIFHMEVVNYLRTAIIRNRITKKQLAEYANQLVRLYVPTKEVDLLAIVRLVLNHNTTSYDASYLALATTLNIPLLTPASSSLEAFREGESLSKVGSF